MAELDLVIHLTDGVDGTYTAECERDPFNVYVADGPTIKDALIWLADQLQEDYE